MSVTNGEETTQPWWLFSGLPV